MAKTRLTPTSYVVLGLIEQMQPASPYDLKRAVAMGVGQFWSLPHTQLYAECTRLAEDGLLTERREKSGRRRRIYRLTQAGAEALDRWRAEPTGELYELRDAGLLKLFFGADPTKIAPQQLQTHEAKLREYEAQLEQARQAGLPDGVTHAIEAGIGHEREYVRFWKRLGGS
ncbi:MAG TPA: PadR family transcriptional regulator [Solirubrobacterales bacterium]|nr:PadR family transcriptional regulator [Solirubrobacterales bacterium]